MSEREDIARRFTEYAREPVEIVELTETQVRVYGSEIACLRIFAREHSNGRNPQAGTWVGWVNQGTPPLYEYISRFDGTSPS